MSLRFLLTPFLASLFLRVKVFVNILRSLLFGGFNFHIRHHVNKLGLIDQLFINELVISGLLT